MPKVSDAHLEARRRQILDAASACFSRQGFHQTSMQDICREAGLSPGAVYRYFSSKEEIIAATCAECQRQGLEVIHSAVQRSEDPLEVLDFLIDSGFAWLDNPESQEYLRMNIQLWGEALRSSQILAEFQQANFGIWQAAVTDLIRRAQERGEVLATLDPESVARVVLSSWHGLMLQRAFSEEVDITSYVAALKAMYRGGIVSESAHSAQALARAN